MASFTSSRAAVAASDVGWFSDEEILTGLHASVSPDGDTVSFFVQYANRPAFKSTVPYNTMAMVSHEVRYAAQLMNYRQRLKLDRGAKAIEELCATALRPQNVEFLVDPHSGDRVVIFQFAENSPLVLRMVADDLTDCLQKLVAINDRSVN